jgi:hypothetical protein
MTQWRCGGASHGAARSTVSWPEIAGGIAGATGHLDKAGQYGGLAGAIAGLGISMLAMKQALEKHLARLSAITAAAGNS